MPDLYTKSENYASALPDNLKELAAYPPKTMAALAANAAGITSQDDAEAVVCASYLRLKSEGKLNITQDRIIFESGLFSDTGAPIDICLTKNRNEGFQPFWLSFSKRVEPSSANQNGTKVQDYLVKKQLTDKVKKDIYRLLLEKFPVEEPLHMASVSKVLLDEGYDRATYGYSKMKAMLSDMSEFLVLADTVMGGVPQTLITIRRVKQWDEETDNQKDAPVISDDNERAAPADVIPRVDLPSNLKDKLTDFAFLPSKTLDILRDYLSGTGISPDADLKEILGRAYELARSENTLRMSDGRLFFETGLRDQFGDPIEVSLKRSSYMAGLPWVLNYIGIKKQTTQGQQWKNTPGKMIEKFAFLGSWANFLNALAGKALPETWNFGGDTHKEFYILQKYIQYTFYRLQLEDKICTDENEGFAAFNTGLVDEHYDDIYACFIANPAAEEGMAKWRFTEFCTAGGRGTGKRLVDCFNPLPQPASYFEKKSDLLYDLEKELLVDFQHIIIDNIRRLPVGFLIEEFHGAPKALRMVEAAQKANDSQQYIRIMKELSEMLEEEHKLFNRLRNRIQDAIDLALKQVRWNFKTAIPCYYPKRNSMSLMLPLCLEDDSKADTALVVEQMRSGNYQGQTILTLKQAYVDARLLCRPNSEWLQTSVIAADDKDDDDDMQDE